MNEPVRLLIAALRSGWYKQGRNRLASRAAHECEFSYCCLGVACELYQLHVGGMQVVTLEKEKRYERENTHLPERVRKWLGFSGHGGELVEPIRSPDGLDRRALRVQALWPTAPAAQPRPYKLYANLVDANDDGFFTFVEIADILERGLVAA